MPAGFACDYGGDRWDGPKYRLRWDGGAAAGTFALPRTAAAIDDRMYGAGFGVLLERAAADLGW